MAPRAGQRDDRGSDKQAHAQHDNVDADNAATAVVVGEIIDPGFSDHELERQPGTHQEAKHEPDG